MGSTKSDVPVVLPCSIFSAPVLYALLLNEARVGLVSEGLDSLSENRCL